MLQGIIKSFLPILSGIGAFVIVFIGSYIKGSRNERQLNKLDKIENDKEYYKKIAESQKKLNSMSDNDRNAWFLSKFKK